MAAASSSRVRTENDFDEITGFVSSSTTLRQQPYDVFINHRGPDVKSKLASPIYHVLDLLKVKAFFDLEELELADSLPQALQNAIRSALIHIAIFSKDYAASPWCLEELSCMLKSGAPIIPVFYDVEPPNLKRWTRGMYADAFSKHEREGRYQLETLKKWKNALHEVAFRDGCIVKSNSEDEGVLLKKIVNRVQREIMEVKMPFELPRYAVGLDDAVKGFDEIRAAGVNQSVQIVGIVGMAGCGKTTLARKLCNMKCSTFDSYSFLSDVREAALHDLQKKLLEDLLHLRDVHSKDVSELKAILAGRFRSSSSRVLIVLDDVDQLDQLNALLPEEGKSLGPGSLIIVTTRDPSVLESWGISIYEMRKLNPCHAKELFCWHAFLDTSPPAVFEDLVQKFLETCDGLPLFIEVIAGMLYGKPEKEWRSNLNKISRSYPQKINDRLRPIYDALEPDEKRIFLDVACFFVGEKEKLAIAVWDAAEWSGLENLVSKCLVEVDKQNRIRMSNILRDLGRQIAIECSPHRLWSPGDFTRIMRYTQHITSIRGIMAATTQFVKCSAHYEFPKCCDYHPPPFERCMGLGSQILLELLVVAGNDFTSDFARLSADLVWLRWFEFEHTNLPSWLSLTKLRVLELYGASSLKQLWEKNVQPPKELREMIIIATEGSSFHKFPSRISGLEHLTKIALISYHGKEFLFRRLPDELCDLRSLEHLELRHCNELEELPNDFGELGELRHLDLCSCQKLRRLPDSFKQLVSLEYLDLSRCVKLPTMPDILVNMRKLEKLYFSGRPKLDKLPLHITEQMSLRELHLKNTNLKDVNNIDQQRKLETLVIGSPHLTGFPASLGNLSSLTCLKITRCIKLESLPESVERLKLLEYLCIKSSGVRSLPKGFKQLTNLRTLKIFDCPIAELDFGSGSASSLGELKVIHLKATNVERLSISQDCCPNLETLQLELNCSLMELEILPSSIKTVNLYDCAKLHTVNGIPGLLNLEIIEIKGCPILHPGPATAATRSAVSTESAGRPSYFQTIWNSVFRRGL